MSTTYAARDSFDRSCDSTRMVSRNRGRIDPCGASLGTVSAIASPICEPHWHVDQHVATVACRDLRAKARTARLPYCEQLEAVGLVDDPTGEFLAVEAVVLRLLADRTGDMERGSVNPVRRRRGWIPGPRQRPTRSLRRQGAGNPQLDHLPQLPEDGGNDPGSGGLVSSNGRRPARPRASVDDTGRLHGAAVGGRPGGARS